MPNKPKSSLSIRAENGAIHMDMKVSFRRRTLVFIFILVLTAMEILLCSLGDKQQQLVAEILVQGLQALAASASGSKH